MPDDILKDAIECVLHECQSIDMDNPSQWDKEGETMVSRIKNHMDERWTPTWHVVIGRTFGSMVTHETKRFLYFYYKNKAVMMYKAG